MPTYEYICTVCSHEFEKFESITAEPSKICPSCGKSSIKRKISAGLSPIFKGSGFYQTDYKNSKPSDSKTSSTGKSSTVKTAGSSDSGTSPAPKPAAPAKD